MERRKLQATGGASLTLTVPKGWANRSGLQSKDEVIIKTSGPALLITPAAASKREITAEITIDDMPPEWLIRELIATYIAGADNVILRSQQILPQQNQAIREAVQLLFGFEIFEESSRKIALRTVLDDSKFSPSESTLMTFSIVRGMFEDALNAAQDSNKDLAADIELRDYEVDKFLYVIKRLENMSMSGKSDRPVEEMNFYANVAVQLERIGDHALKIAELASSDRTMPVQLSSTFPAIKIRLSQLLEEAESLLKTLDKRQAHNIIDTNIELERLIYSSRRMKQSYDGAILEDSLDRLRGYLMNIAELAIDYRYAKILLGSGQK